MTYGGTLRSTGDQEKEDINPESLFTLKSLHSRKLGTGHKNILVTS